MTQDMTVGSPWKLIIHFTIPIAIGNLFQQLYAIIDTIIVGRYVGVNALAAVGATGSLNFLVIGWIMGMTSGFSILISQAFGAKDQRRLRHYTAMCLYLCIGMTVILTAAFLILNIPILRVMKTPENILDDTALYIGIIYAGLFATVAYNMLSAILRSLGDSKTPLCFLILSSLLNVGLDLLLIRTFHMGVAGAAYATVIAQAVSALLCFLYMRKKYRILAFNKEEAAFSGQSFRYMIMMGIPMGLQFSITAIGTMIVQTAINVFGPTHIAAFAAAGKVHNLTMQPMTALGSTMATYAGQNRGAGDMERVKKGVNAGIVVALILGAFASLILFFFGGACIRFFVSEDITHVVKIARQYFYVVIAFEPFLALIFVYRNALQGMGDGLLPMIGGIFELAARGAVIAVLAGPFGYIGICFSDPLAWLGALIILVPVYYHRMYRKNVSHNS